MSLVPVSVQQLPTPPTSGPLWAAYSAVNPNAVGCFDTTVVEVDVHQGFSLLP